MTTPKQSKDEISESERDKRVHLAHCYQGEDYRDGCKYGEEDCPAKPSKDVDSSQDKMVTIDDVLKWPEIGDTYNEDYGVDGVRAKKINGAWAYVQLEWRYHVPSVGFIFYNGKSLEELNGLVVTDKEPK